eukprot:1623786-Amphidinium_carterae.1
MSACAEDTFLEPSKSKNGRYAYVIALWGTAKHYVLGALVLGQSLLQTGTKHALVCMYTDDVPPAYLELLQRVWDCRRIEHVQYAADRLCFVDEQCSRFEKVFTKLQVFRLVEFEKVLMMDIDMLVLRKIDDLFELRAPAAMRRGATNEARQTYHGSELNGLYFFGGPQPSNQQYSWGQGTGINAGVMLLEPSEQTWQIMMDEIQEANHPEHVRGAQVTSARQPLTAMDQSRTI